MQAPRITPDNYQEIHAETDTAEGNNISLLDYCTHYGLESEPAYDSIWIHNDNGEISVGIEEYSGKLDQALEEDEDFVDRVHDKLGDVINNNGAPIQVVWYSGFDRHMYCYIEAK